MIKHIAARQGRSFFSHQGRSFFSGLTLVGVTFIVLLMFAEQSDAQILPETVVGMWLFNEGDIKGNVAKDYSQNELVGNIKGAPKLASGKFAKALELNGSNEYVDFEEEESLNITDAITVVGWMNTTTIARWNVVASKEIWNSNAGWVLYISTDTRPAFAVSSAGETAKGATAVATDTWYHIAGVADSSGSVKVYLNGEQDGTGSSKLTNADTNLRIGARRPNGGGDGIVDPFPGILDEVAIFNVALTEDFISSIMNDGLERTIKAAVSPKAKLTTTWASIKNQ